MKKNMVENLRKYAPSLLVLLAVIVSISCYMQAINAVLTGDDVVYIVNNQKLINLPLSQVWRVFTEPFNSTYEFLPLRDLSYRLEMIFTTTNPVVFRTDNIIIYALSIPLVYAITRRLQSYCCGQNEAALPWFAATVSSIFAIHPALVESVVWVSGRKYILANLLALLAMWLALNVKQSNKWSSKYAGATLIAFIGVMFSKSSFIGLAPMIALLWVSFWLETPKHERRYHLLAWPAGLIITGVLLLIIFIINNDGYDSEPLHFSSDVITRALAILGGLERIAISPEGRHFFYPVYNVESYPLMVFLGTATITYSVWGGMQFLRNRSLSGLAIISFVLLCAPYLQIFPSKPPSYVADRYISLAIYPMILWFVNIIWMIRGQLRVVMLGMIIFLYSYQTVCRSVEWMDSASFIKNDYFSFPEYYMPAFAYLQNTAIIDGKFKEAIEGARRVKQPQAQIGMIKLFEFEDEVFKGNIREALSRLPDLEKLIIERPEASYIDGSLMVLWSYFRQVLTKECNLMSSIQPDNLPLRYRTALCLLRMNPRESIAATRLQSIVDSSEASPLLKKLALKDLGIALIVSGRATEAEAPILEYLRLAPEDKRSQCLLLEVYHITRRTTEAISAARLCQ
jgi:hypothetical protein